MHHHQNPSFSNYPVYFYLQLNSEQYEALIKKLQSERDFYYSECCRLKEQKDVTASCTNVSGGTKFLQKAHDSQYMRDFCSSRFCIINYKGGMPNLEMRLICIICKI
jgi:hypothetical protein